MEYGHRRLNATFAAGASKTTGIYIGGGWKSVHIEVPTFNVALSTTTANIYIEGSYIATTTAGQYRRVAAMGVYSAGSGILDWEVPSSLGNRIYVCEPAAKFDYLKVALSTAATAGLDCWLHVHA